MGEPYIAHRIPVAVSNVGRSGYIGLDDGLCERRRRLGEIGQMNRPGPYERDPRVDQYFDSLPAWQGELCRQLRDLIHAADPGIEETIKRTDRPYFVLAGNICAVQATKDHINLFVYDGAIVPDPEGLITGGHENQTARTISFREGDPVRRRALTAMLREIIANNRA